MGTVHEDIYDILLNSS